MCLPLPILAIAGTAMSAIGTGVGALSANAQAHYRAKVDEQNARLAGQAAATEQENTRQAALAQYRKSAQVQGQQRVAAGANGVGTDFGTAGDVVADTKSLASEDVNRIYQQGDQRVKGYDINAANYMGQANADRAAGSAALIGGVFNMGSTVLGGVQQYARLKPDYSNVKMQQKGR